MMVKRIERVYAIEPVQRITGLKRVKRLDNRYKSGDAKKFAEIKDERVGKYVDITVEGPIYEKYSYSYWV